MQVCCGDDALMGGVGPRGPISSRVGWSCAIVFAINDRMQELMIINVN